MPNQNLGQGNCLFPVPNGIRAAVTNISQANSGFAPVLDPLVQLLEIPRQFGTDRVCLGFGPILDQRWSSLIQSFKQVHRFQSSSAVLGTSAFCGVASMISPSLGSGFSGLLNSSTSPPPAVRSILMMNLSCSAAAPGPFAANVSSTLLASIRCFADALVSDMMLSKMSGALTMSCCARSRLALPSRTRLTF